MVVKTFPLVCLVGYLHEITTQKTLASDIFQRLWCQTATWLEAGTEKRTAIKERFLLFHRVHESSLWQNTEKEQGWSGRTIRFFFFSCNTHYTLRTKLFQTHQKTLQFFFTFFCEENRPNTNSKVNKIHTLHLKHWKLFSAFI